MNSETENPLIEFFSSWSVTMKANQGRFAFSFELRTMLQRGVAVRVSLIEYTPRSGPMCPPMNEKEAAVTGMLFQFNLS